MPYNPSVTKPFINQKKQGTMELLIAFLIAFGIINSNDADALMKDADKVESIYRSSGLSDKDLEAYKKKIIEIEQDGM